MAQSILDAGFARLVLSPAHAETLLELRHAATDFFSRDEGDKVSFGGADVNFGYRPYGRQYSITPDRPDMNESFAFWGRDAARLPRGNDIPDLVRTLRRYRETMACIAGELLAQFAARFAYGDGADLGFEHASCVEINWYTRAETRELLQERHEDGHLFTVVTADGPGLEIEVAGQTRPVRFSDAELLIMPGSLLTHMSAGAIRPLYHQVRNHRLPHRMSVLYLANPALDRRIRPYVEADENRGVDIAELARTNGTLFGLPPAPVIDRRGQDDLSDAASKGR